MKEKIDRGYEPMPIDTSCVGLPHELDEKIEQLARNNHEVWAQERQQGGWTYGTERDDVRKEHPSLVPYEDLPESEKDVDRETVVQTLKAAVALGCKIRVAENHSPGIIAQIGLSGDDMAEWPPLPPDFQQRKEDLLMTYLAADSEARLRFREHFIATLFSAGFGTAAVVLAIFELADKNSHYSKQLEFICAGLALLAVLAGIFRRLMKKWLLERHRAERCRFAKYRVLLQLAAAGDDGPAVDRCLKQFECVIKEIRALDSEDLEEFMEEDPIPEDSPRVHAGGKVQQRLQELVDHYVTQRLQAQAKYFLTQSRKKAAIDARVKVLPPFLFFLSTLLALVHFSLNRVSWFEKIDPYWIFAVAALPVLGSGIRLGRSALEYSRNTLRYRAKYRALEQLMVELEEAQQRNAVVHAMWKGELILEQEHREWLRLMTEAEWFG